MTTDTKDFAPEQYELNESPAYQFSVNRRDFFKILGSGLAITFVASNSLASSLLDDKLAEDQIGAWIHIGENGRVTVFTGKVEVGQNIRTSLAQVVADELEVPLESIDMVMGDTALTPYDRGTFGSRTTGYMAPQLRKAAASARELLLDMAADKWKVSRTTLKAQVGKVVRDKTTSISYSELTKGKELIKGINDQVKTKSVEQWKIAGTSVPKVNGESFVTGKHKYVSDMKLPGMLYGKILRPPSWGATLSSVDVSAARSMKEVTIVEDGSFVGVAASSVRLATEALKAIKAEWKPKSQLSRNQLFEHLVKSSEKKEDNENGGNVSEAFQKADIKVEQTFFIDYIAHVPLEPRAGVAQWTNNKLTVWTGTQRPFGVQEELEEAFGISKDNIRVIMPDTGSGYGGKHTGEAGIEAARLARETKTPVKVVWTREEEFMWAYVRPAGVITVKAGADKNGIVTTWDFHNYNSGASGIETSYTVANKRTQFHPSDSPLRQGSYRGLASTANVFAREAIMDDLAVAIQMDPLAFRLKNLSDERMKGVLEAAAEKFGWSTLKKSANHGYGVACGAEKGSYVATCAEVMVDPASKEVKVLRAAVAFECGAIINPVHLHNQIEGALVQGLGGALFERVDFKDGKIISGKLSQYRVPRFKDVPKLEIVMVNRKDIPSVGAGETPIVGIAPAIRNAILNATGKKLYTLPLVPDGVSS